MAEGPLQNLDAFEADAPPLPQVYVCVCARARVHVSGCVGVRACASVRACVRERVCCV